LDVSTEAILTQKGRKIIALICKPNQPETAKERARALITDGKKGGEGVDLVLP